jgi:hypothetical protein
MPNYFDQFDAPPATAPPQNYFDQFDAKPEQSSSPASTLGYIGSRFLGAGMESGRLGALADPSMALAPGATDALNAMGSGQQAVNQAIYGQPDVAAPNAAARYGGAVAGAVGANPLMAAIGPGYTVAGALGGEGASDLNKAYGPSWMPDWAARLMGGVAGGGVYGAAKSLPEALTTSGADKVLADVADTKAAIQNGQGMYGEFQQKAQAASASLASVKPPIISPTRPVALNSTIDLLTKPTMPVPEGASQLTDVLNQTGGTLPYASVRAWLNQVGPGPLYTSINNDLKSSIGEDAAAQLTKSNQASQAQFLLNSAQTPSGFYDPTRLTKALAKNPQGDSIGGVTPEMDAMTDHAGQITDMMSQWYKGAQPAPSAVGQIAKQAAKGAASLGIGHVTGNPELGGVLMGYLLGHGEPSARVGNLLYGIQQPSMAARNLPWLAPSASAGLLSQ